MERTRGMILVSACLAGRPCRYDGRHSLSRPLLETLKDQPWVAVCPEQLGGLTTPRTPAGIKDGDGRDVLTGRARVINVEHADVTQAFLRGAETALDLALKLGVTTCYLKDRSPSCGLSLTETEGAEVHGSGVFAALALRNGLTVIEVKAASV